MRILTSSQIIEFLIMKVNIRHNRSFVFLFLSFFVLRFFLGCSCFSIAFSINDEVLKVHDVACQGSRFI